MAKNSKVDDKSFDPQKNSGVDLKDPVAETLKPMFELETKAQEDATIYDVIMIGGGPCSLTAAIYTCREDIKTVIYEKGVIGGMASITDWVDNYPGFPDGISGMDLGENLRRQAERFGAMIEVNEVTNIQRLENHLRLSTIDGDKFAKSVLIGTGCDYKKVGVPGEEEYFARGVHYCATCDGAFYRDKKLLVIGGGNSAVQEALFLTRFAVHIDLLVRSTVKASDILIHELEKSDKITVHEGITPIKIIGDGKFVKSVKAKETTGKKELEFKTDGVFVFVGLRPNTGFLKDCPIDLDEIGFVKTDDKMQTSMKGVFAAGDVRSGATMQIASAVGEGATAALRIREYLENRN
jgi:thioredoxin reductase (NADPH)